MKNTPLRRPRAPYPQRPAPGTSLVEVLVAVLILSFGLLGMAAIHAASMRETKTNQFKIAAEEIATMLGDAIKANAAAQVLTPVPGILGGETVSANGGYVIAGVGSANSAPANRCDDPAALACTPAQIAAVDLFRARAAATANLPQGDVMATVVNAATTSPALDIWVHWVRPDFDPGSTDAALDSTRVQCPPAIQALTPPRQCLRHTVPL
jgi:type IV pilus assembly protein PilV